MGPVRFPPGMSFTSFPGGFQYTVRDFFYAAGTGDVQQLRWSLKDFREAVNLTAAQEMSPEYQQNEVKHIDR
jgi:hypothetical protein